MTQDGTPNRETSGQILFNNDMVDGHFVWFMDPDPLSNSAFGARSDTSADLGGGSINVSRMYWDYSSLVGPEVLACLQCTDLFSTALHEIGHSLGMSAANTSFSAEAADQYINITSPLPFAGTALPLVANGAAHFDNSDVLAGSIMAGPYGKRQYLSDADILAVAQLSSFHDLNLNPTPVPVPTSVLSLLSGLMLLVLLARRRTLSSLGQANKYDIGYGNGSPLHG